MDYPQRLARLFDYDAWASLRILGTLQEHSSFERREEAVEMFYHILNAHRLWRSRITGQSTEVELWPDDPGLSDAPTRTKQVRDSWKDLIYANRGSLSRLISYRNTKGDEYETRLDDILNHIVIHGQHHRAQIAKMMRYSGIAPPPTDFIFYTREADQTTDANSRS